MTKPTQAFIMTFMTVVIRDALVAGSDAALGSATTRPGTGTATDRWWTGTARAVAR